MEEEFIDTCSKGPVALVFHRRGVLFPALVILRGKRLGLYQRFAFNMAYRCSFYYTIAGVKSKAFAPELRHRHIGNAPQVEIGSGVHIIGLDGEVHAMLMG